MRRKARIAVIGAGLGGLTAAGFLQRAGFAVKVYEQAPAFSRIGAGIILSANVTKVLRRLGLEDGLIAAGVRSRSYVSRAWDTGETMAEFIFNAESERRYGGPYVHIHRGDLHAVLERGVAPGTIAFDHQLLDLKEDSGATRLVFANGTTSEADVVIGADGVRSKVREFVLGAEPPQFVGAGAYRAIFPAERLNGFYIPDCTKWWGSDRHCLPYYLTGRRDEVYAIGVVPASTWEHGDTSIPASREQYLESFAGFHSDLQRVLEAVGDVTLWPIFDRMRNDRWSGGPRGRAVLLGDACHPMRPFMAAGGAMAVEDAAILSRCLDKFDDAAKAFRRYEATRIPRVTKVQEISIANTWMRGPHETEWFYCYDACTAPLAGP
ncbi:MAG: FAD-dependent oxidoreductase [Xanthobacteraceae bacterium]